MFSNQISCMCKTVELETDSSVQVMRHPTGTYIALHWTQLCTPFSYSMWGKQCIKHTNISDPKKCIKHTNISDPKKCIKHTYISDPP